MTKIVFLDRGTIGPSVKINQPKHEHEWVEFEQTSVDQIVERAGDADVIITNKVPLREDVIAQLPNLKMVSVAATGYDVLDLQALLSRKIVASNVRGYAEHTVPEHTVALMMALRRGLVGYRQDVLDGEWQKAGQFCFFTHPISDLHGATLGIFGEGVIGQGVARIATALGMKVKFAAHKGVSGLGPLYTDFDEVIETSDVITVHCPLTDATRNMIAKREFDMMKRKPILLNTSRGGLIDEGDAAEALQAGKIAALGFDVLTTEPPKDDNPLMKIAHLPNVIVTPHVAWASHEAMQTLWDQCVSHVDNFLDGKPSNVLG